MREKPGVSHFFNNKNIVAHKHYIVFHVSLSERKCSIFQQIDHEETWKLFPSWGFLVINYIKKGVMGERKEKVWFILI